ncbi:flagella basal body P-ring formation protein FlgA [Jannaschia faecimaris]|uniref:Flagella basal body P-ring formation protein FlgA n=1 Tax=Jannaschia faecimaris TaxID=1244108 RepID=A0A1H3JWP4_9RHOB|nr:flagellar basal body P-ring formation chaperone FlgA [Jannaschia faecimaris]SDY44377.1 flagella basal body P-ring formation protein FlgA [Jannaschia faecimaris]
MIRLILFLLVSAGPAAAQSVMALHAVRAGTTLSGEDLAFHDADATDGFSDPRDVIGLEARVNLYPGRPILTRDVGLPTVVERNEIVPLIFKRRGLSITLEGRALGRAGAGETVRVMNLSSRNTVIGVATETGQVVIQ